MTLALPRSWSLRVLVLIVALAWPAGRSVAEVRFYSLNEELQLRVDSPDGDLSRMRAQQASMWCWAASVQSAYAAQGARFEQAQIVGAIKGALINQGGSPVEIAAALRMLGRDNDGREVVSDCAVLAHRGGDRYVNVATGDEARAPGLILPLSYGIPAILCYRTGPNSGHAVLITGMSVDDDMRVLHYQIEDPWPLDDMGRPISNGEAVRKQMSASAVNELAMHIIIPIIVTNDSESRVRKFLEDMPTLEREAREPGFNLERLDEITGARVSSQRYDDRRELHEALDVQASLRGSAREGDEPGADPARAGEADRRSEIAIDDQDVDWDAQRASERVRVRLTYRNDGSEKARCTLVIAVGTQLRDDSVSDHSSWRETGRRSFTRSIEPGETTTITATLRWEADSERMPVVRYWTGDEEDAEFLELE